ncbi:Aste57867_13745 [Aphanomyces stellatus]|uniref:Aste57867_13745 protein n=1 Tax=Aphanomyces stellatus TaxID=120398 RepID=A0A485KYV5_9STRA|nr:hypothetical protein As57867_013695 [Aphanomyces stellatus]VFT90578.1 Aste57867_13745 [Aphanomyces stellatus]
MFRAARRLHGRRIAQDFQKLKLHPTVLSFDVHSCREHNTSAAANDSASQGAEAMKITRVGMYVNIAMAACKGTIGCAVNSSALIADAAHSLSDLLSDVVTLWSVRISRLPPDEDHPYGYGKFEAVGSLTVGAILTAAGVGMGYDAFQILQTGVDTHAASLNNLVDLSFLTSLDRSTQWGIAAGAAVVSIAAKEALYHATVRIGKQANSKVLIANAWHHRTDAISSFVALGGIFGAMLHIPLFDPIAGAVVSCMIAKTGVDICLDRFLRVRHLLAIADDVCHSVRELTDKSVEDEVLDLLRHSSSSVEDVVSVSNVRARRMGPYTMVDLRINVHGRTSVSAAQQVAARVKAEVLRQVPDVSEVLVHIDVATGRASSHGISFTWQVDGAPVANAEHMRPYREIKQDVLRAVKAIPEIQAVTHVNAHWVVRAPTALPHELGHAYGTLLDVTIVVQPDMTVREVHNVARRARREIEGLTYVVEADVHLELYDEETTVSDGDVVVGDTIVARAAPRKASADDGQ